MIWRCLLAFAILLSAPARAQTPTLPSDPDTEVATREFRRGSELYDVGRYEEAIAAFERAQEIKPAPDFDYNIARCYDRLGRWSDAVKFYERYLAAAKPKGPDELAETKARVDVLKERIKLEAAHATTAPSPDSATPALSLTTPQPPIHKRRWFWPVVGGAAVVVVALAVGLGVGLSASPHDPSPTIGTVRWGQ
jgi:tetratricopeptide (TPR) repeat protein